MIVLVPMEDSSCMAISVVSHGQGKMISLLLDDLKRLNLFNGKIKEIFVTINIPEDESFLDEFSSLPLRVLRNEVPKGFGKNHNQAFSVSNSRIFLVVNPDIRLPYFDCSPMLTSLSDPATGIWAPLIVSLDGVMEDSARKFPTFLRLLYRFVFKRRKSDYCNNSVPIEVEWVGGMFMALNSRTYNDIGGFDEAYFMYMEDVDICRRLHRKKFKIIFDPRSSVTHNAQRGSHKNLRHLSWHARSAIRFLTRI